MSDNELLQSIDKIKEFDLNLLVTFEAVFIHQSVSKAANLLGVSSSSVSQALAKLRISFSDPLFIREGKGLVPTTVADNLHTHLSDGFRQLLNSLDYFSDASTKSKFVVHSTAYAALRFMPEICAKIESSGIDCEIHHISSDAMLDSIEDVLIYRKADIVFDTKPYYSFSTVTLPFIDEIPIPVCRRDHPRIGSKLTVENLLEENSTLLNVGAEGVKKIHYDILKNDIQRTFSFNSSSIITNIAVIEKTDAVGFIPKWIYEKCHKSFNIKMLDFDIEATPITYYMTYNKSALKNPTFIRLLEVISECKPLF